MTPAAYITKQPPALYKDLKGKCSNVICQSVIRKVRCRTCSSKLAKHKAPHYADRSLTKVKAIRVMCRFDLKLLKNLQCVNPLLCKLVAKYK